MKRLNLKLSEQRKHELKIATVDYLKNLHSPLNELEYALLAPGALTPRYRTAGTILLEPDSPVSEAYYLQTGLAILYTIDEKTGAQKILYIWEEKSVIILYEEFKEKLPSGDYYIKLIEDSELVSITNFCMEDIYRQHTVAYLLTQKILNLKTKRSRLQLDILLMENKGERLAVYEARFPNLKGRLTTEQICAFIGIKPSTLNNSKTWV